MSNFNSVARWNMIDANIEKYFDKIIFPLPFDKSKNTEHQEVGWPVSTPYLHHSMDTKNSVALKKTDMAPKCTCAHPNILCYAKIGQTNNKSTAHKHEQQGLGKCSTACVYKMGQHSFAKEKYARYQKYNVFNISQWIIW